MPSQRIFVSKNGSSSSVPAIFASQRSMGGSVDAADTPRLHSSAAPILCQSRSEMLPRLVAMKCFIVRHRRLGETQSRGRLGKPNCESPPLRHPAVACRIDVARTVERQVKGAICVGMARRRRCSLARTSILFSVLNGQQLDHGYVKNGRTSESQQTGSRAGRTAGGPTLARNQSSAGTVRQANSHSRCFCPEEAEVAVSHLRPQVKPPARASFPATTRPAPAWRLRPAASARR